MPRRIVLSLALVAVVVVTVLVPIACAKPDRVTRDDTGRTSSPSVSSAPLASAASSETTNTAAAGVPSGAPTSTAVECGTRPLPDCPLQAWMKANANPPTLTGDLPGLAAALDKMIGFAPPGYTNWSSISKDGAAAARAGDLSAAKAACRACHDQYKQKYKTEIRARKI